MVCERLKVLSDGREVELVARAGEASQTHAPETDEQIVAVLAFIRPAPVWLMRQAGRYLPEFESRWPPEIRSRQRALTRAAS